MFDNLGTLAVALILIGSGLVATARYVIAKTTGKEMTPGDSDILGQLRTKLVNGFATNQYLIELEKTDGRQAVLDEIEVRINEFIDDTETLSPLEKDLLISLDKSQLVKYIEQQLIRLKILI